MHDIRMSLFDLVEQHNGVGAPSHRFGKLTAFFVAHIARRRTDQARPGEFLHVLRHVDLNQSVGVTKHELRQGTRQKRFSDAGWTQEMNDPIERRGSFRSARERLNALLMAITASSWPMTCCFSSSSILRSFCASFCSMRFSGTPVHFDTMCMISSPATMTSRSSRCSRHSFKIRSSLFLACCSESRNAAAFS